MKKKILIFFLLLSIIGLLIFFVKSRNQNDKNILTLYGNIEIRQVDLSFQISGQIAELYKEEGDAVKKGELLAIIDDRDYRANFDKAVAEVRRTNAVKLDTTEKYERYAPLSDDDTVSKRDAEALLNDKNRAEAEYNAAAANKNYLKNQLDYTKLYAPDDGIIMTRIHERGATVAKGQSVYTMAKIKPVWVRAYVNETDLGNIKYGQKVNVYTDTVNLKTGKKREYKGQIGYISPTAEFTPKTVQSTDIRTNLVYRIRVYISDIDEYLRQGMPVTIKIDLISKGGNGCGNN